MIGRRHEAIGTKQVIRIEWMQRAANLLLAGLDAKTIRQELHDFLSGFKGSGASGERGEYSRSQVVNMLMRIWITPDTTIIPLRDESLAFLRENPSLAMAVHWCMLSAAYPFWFSVASQTGRLLSLQDQVTQAQIITRLREKYGDRQTVSRYGRYSLRSFVAWGVLRDVANKACYEKEAPLVLADLDLAVLLLESALLATPSGKGQLALFLNHPAFFPLKLPAMTGDAVIQRGERIDVIRYGPDDELLTLRTTHSGPPLT